MMYLHQMGMFAGHDSSFEINRPNGSGDDLLLIFKTGAVAEIGGKTVDIAPDSALLYRKGEPQFYRACEGTYVDHWIHMDCGGDGELGGAFDMPFNEVVKLTNCAEAEEIMHMLVREELSRKPSKERCIDLLLRMLLIKLGDSRQTDRSAEVRSPYNSVLLEIRTGIYSTPSRFHSIEQLAAEANLSASYFQRLYREQFGISCYEDMLTARVRTAQRYLTDTDMTIREIALSCGYENDVVFMRRFKKRTGLTPGAYRKRFG